jgi:hypothetical protein
VKNQQGMKLFAVLLVSTLFIYSFSHFGALTYNAMTTEDDLFLPGTSIGSVDVTGISKSDVLQPVTDRLVKWQNETNITLKYKEKTIPVNLELYNFDVPLSIAQAQNGQANNVIATIDSNNVKSLLQQLSSKLELADTDLEKLTSELLSYGNNLNIGEHKVSIEKILEQKAQNEVISETVLSFDDASVAMMDWVAGLTPITIPAESQFSFLKIIEEKKLSSMPASAQSMIASGIYKTILPTNFKIIERHIGQELPNSIDLGYEAKINKDNNLDLAFTNPNDYEYRIELKWHYPTLTVQLKGTPFLYNYEVETSAVTEYKPKTIVQYSPLLYPSQKNVKDYGRNGQLIEVKRNVFAENGELIMNEPISEDYYAPVERIEVHGLTSTATNTSTSTSTNNNGTSTDPNGTETPVENGAGTEVIRENDSNDEDNIWGKPNEAEK